MRLGIGSYAYAWSIGVPGHVSPAPMTAFDFLRKAKSLNVGVVQICDNLPLDALEPRDAERLARLAEDLGIAIEVGTRGIRPDHLDRYLRLARLFRSPILRVVVDTADHKPAPREVVSLLRPKLAEFEAAGVSLAIENHDRFPSRELRRIVERLDSPCAGICLDTVNSFGALEGPEAVVEGLAPYVVSLHVKDFVIRRVDHQMGFRIEGCPAGQGRLDVPWLLDRLRSHGRDVNAILEQWPPPCVSLEKTIAKEDKWAVESVNYLRTLIPDSNGK